LFAVLGSIVAAAAWVGYSADHMEPVPVLKAFEFDAIPEHERPVWLKDEQSVSL
jgi:hypothetical protein